MRRVRQKYWRAIPFASRVVTIPNERVFFQYNKICFAQYTQLSLKQCERGRFTPEQKKMKQEKSTIFVREVRVRGERYKLNVCIHEQ